MGREIYSQIAGSTANNKSDYIKKGSGQAVILECLKKVGNDGEVFVARLKILSSKPKDGSKPNEPGDVVGWPQLLTKFKATAMGNVKSFVLNTAGVQETEVTADQFIEQFEDAINYTPGAKSEYNGRAITAVQDFRGMLVNYDTYDQQTKAQKAAKSNETNTYVKFAHVSDQGDLEARKAELDKTNPIQG